MLSALKRMMKIEAASLKKNSWLILILAIGLLIRLIDISRPFSGLGKWNEGHYATTALNYFTYGIFMPVNEYGLDLTTTPIFSWFIYIFFLIFGVHEWAARLPALIFGMASLVIVYFLARRLYGEKIALASTFITAVSPGTAYFSRNIQLESMFTAFALASLLFLIYFKETHDVKWLVASGFYISIAILTKYPAVLTYPALLWVWFKYGEFRKESQSLKRLALYVVAPIIPSLIWILYAISVKPTLTTWYFSKPDAPWALANAKTALLLSVTKYIPEHFGYFFYIPFVLSIFWLFKESKKHMVLLLFTFPWFLLIFAFPDFYLSNMYYHYTMLYGMSILLGYSSVMAGEKWIKKPNLKIIVPLIGVIILALSLYQYNTYFHSYYTDFSSVDEPEPFYSAKYVSEINLEKDLIVADLPMTQYYLGGNHEHIKLAYTTEGLIEAVKENKYTYLVTYYKGNRTLRETLETHNYSQIAPRAWKKSP
jgi:4-amino-4-deoxy-L-arabinose transferase-like glycosyltransferase